MQNVFPRESSTDAKKYRKTANIFVTIKICGNFNNVARPERPKNNFIHKPIIRLSGRVYTLRVRLCLTHTD